MSDLVSIIVPVYNAEKYIAKCIESIINQTYTNIEVILVDDESVDNSEVIIKSYMKTDGRIKYVSQKNSGPSASRNKGIKQATGTYIAFIDSDDWIDLNMIEEMVFKMKKEKSDLVLCDFVLETNIKPIYNKVLLESNNVSIEGLKEKLVNNDILNSVWNRLYKREIIISNNIKFNNFLKVGEDQIFNMEYVGYSKNVSYIEKSFYHYRMISNSTCRKIHKNQIEMLEYQQNLRNYIINGWLDYKYKYNIESAKWFLQNIASYCYLSSIRLRGKERKEVLDSLINSKITNESLDIIGNKKVIYDANVHRLFIPLIKKKNQFLIIQISRIYYILNDLKTKILK